MATGNALSGLAAGLANGSLRIVDLTMPLGPETPVLPLSSPVPELPDVRRDRESRATTRAARPGIGTRSSPHAHVAPVVELTWSGNEIAALAAD